MAPYAKEKVDKSVQVEFSLNCTSSLASTCEIPMENSEIVGCLLNSNLPSRPCSVSGVLQPELVGAALSNSIVDSLLNNLIQTVVSSSVANKPLTVVDVPKEDKWLEDMVVAINKLKAKYGAKYKPIEEDGVIHSAQVAVPRIDFSQVKPHLHRKLPKPDSVPVQACSIDPNFYTSCTICANARIKGFQHPEHNYRACSPPFEQPLPFGALPGFVTSQGVVAVPVQPIGGYVYAGGTGDATKWQLHAQEVFV